MQVDYSFYLKIHGYTGYNFIIICNFNANLITGFNTDKGG